eukprot:GHVH01007386.1.p1 GENE.GHVH01007386.1~~GHVH01007386.1.p1  ORF type:complete len:206 (+),score=26.58 GHVH01007386.1:87-704(+)
MSALKYGCSDVTVQELQLFHAINKRRMGQVRLYPIPMGRFSFATAKYHVEDNADAEYARNILGGCDDVVSLHAWRGYANDGAWTSCCYDGTEETSHCMWDKISEVSRSASNSLGYEIAIGYQPGTVEFDDCMASTIESDSYNLKNKTASELLDIWVNSDYHRSVIDNENEWADFYWTRIGVSVGKCVASAWFTTERSDPICFTSL